LKIVDRTRDISLNPEGCLGVFRDWCVPVPSGTVSFIVSINYFSKQNYHRHISCMSYMLHVHTCMLYAPKAFMYTFQENESHVPVVSVLHVELAGRSIASMV